MASEVSRHGVDSAMAPECNPATPASGQWPALWTGWIDRYTRRWSPSWPGGGRSAPSSGRDDGPTFSTRPTPPTSASNSSGRSTWARRGRRVVLFTAPCYDSGEQFDGAPWPEDQPDRVHAYNALVRQVVAANPQTATLVNLDGVVCPGGVFKTQIDGVTVRAPDGVHFPYSYDPGNPQAALDSGPQVMAFGAWIGPRLWPSIVAAGQKKAHHGSSD